MRSPGGMVLKRTLDLSVGVIGVILAAPILSLAAIAIVLESGRPVVFADTRIGRGGARFKLHKLRTMVQRAREISPVVSTPTDDPRVTRVGRVLRLLSIDELPQLWNVLRGDMSIVGPRPEVPEYLSLWTPEEAETILSVRPGLTDWATLWVGDKGQRLKGFSDPEEVYRTSIKPVKTRLQIAYVQQSTCWDDLVIISRTAFREVLGRVFTAVRSRL